MYVLLLLIAYCHMLSQLHTHLLSRGTQSLMISPYVLLSTRGCVTPVQRQTLQGLTPQYSRLAAWQDPPIRPGSALRFCLPVAVYLAVAASPLQLLVRLQSESPLCLSPLPSQLHARSPYLAPLLCRSCPVVVQSLHCLHNSTNTPYS